ncbi:hypothetical protein MNV49_000232 [Pseudohyphozyma bogoriensis]|nr:hypothetical protein MNV49_000232 [Pseudohyphozyma bogoriensis]
MEDPPPGFLTSSEVLLATPQLIAKRTRLPPADIPVLVAELAKAVEKPSKTHSRTVADILGLKEPTDEAASTLASQDEFAELGDNEVDWFTTSDEGLDVLLGNGVRLGSITEIAGQSAAGKSHLCLQLSLTVQLARELSGLSGGTIFISSEGHMPSPRLLQLASSLISRLPTSSPDNSRSKWDYLDNIHASKAQDVEHLDALLSYIIPAQIDRIASHAESATPLPPSPSDDDDDDLSIPTINRDTPPKPPLPIKLLIIDSIAAPFRGDANSSTSSSEGFIKRSKDFAAISDKLKRLAAIYNIAVILVNQVSAVFSKPPLASFSSTVSSSSSSPSSTPSFRPPNEDLNLPRLLFSRYQTPHFSGESKAFHSQAALGHSWSNIVNTRVMLHRMGRKRVMGGEFGNEEPTVVRRANLVFSPYAPRGSVDYVLEEEGLRSIGEVKLRENCWVGEEDEGEVDGGRNEVGGVVDEEEEMWKDVGDLEEDSL